MGIQDILPLFGRSKEKHTLKLIKQHLSKLTQTGTLLIDFYIALESGDNETMKNKRDEIVELEDECDDLLHEVMEELYNGAFLPITRSRIFEFLQKADNLADKAKDAANISLTLEKMSYDPNINSLLLKLAKRVYKVTKLLEAAYLSTIDDVAETKKLLKKIRQKESQSDQTKAEIYHLLYELNDPRLFFTVAGVTDAIASIADSAESAGDQLSIMIITNTA